MNQWKQFAYPLTITLIVAGAVVYWIQSTPSDEEVQRENACKNWGYDDEASLARCRQSQAGVDAVIAPKFRKAKLKAIVTFDEELYRVSQNRTQVSDADYRPAQIAEIAKGTGGFLGTTKAKNALEGQKVKLAGRIITDTPDPNDQEEGEKSWEPQAFQLWGPLPKGKTALPNLVDLDIESLNRDERKFIQDRCGIVEFTRCDATILGHVGTVTEEREIGLRHLGVVVDAVVISPVNIKDADSSD